MSIKNNRVRFYQLDPAHPVSIRSRSDGFYPRYIPVMVTKFEAKKTVRHKSQGDGREAIGRLSIMRRAGCDGAQRNILDIETRR